MLERIINRTKIGIVNLLLLGLLFMSAAGCNKAPAKVFTIGIVGFTPYNVETLEGFRGGMKELGFEEGKDIKYIHSWITENKAQVIDEKIREVCAQDADLIFTMGINVDLRAKELLKGTGMPILFSASALPVQNGLVDSLKHPGGDMTGIAIAQGGDSKALEWLATIIPGVKRFYLPYNPDDAISMKVLAELDKTASQIGVELVLEKIHSVEEAVEGIENLSRDVNAVFMIPSPTLNARSGELSQAAIRRGIPTGASLSVDKAVLMTLAPDLYNAGRQAARMAHQIHQGVNPAELPVETADLFLTVNLNTAEKIGFSIPDDILSQSTTIIH